MSSQKKKNAVHKEIVYGAHAIIELAKAKKRKILSLYTTKPLPRAWERIKPYLPKSIPNIQYVERNVLSSLAKGPEHMGVVAVVTPFQFRSTLFNPAKEPFILVLDSIQDVGNLGAILRTAYCAGVDGVVLTTKGAAPLTAAVFKASAGLAEHLEIYRASSLKATIQELKKAGYHFYMAVPGRGTNALQVDYKRPCCLVIGNEAEGIDKELVKEGTLLTLPQRSSDVSYNASVAAGILLFLMAYKKS